MNFTRSQFLLVSREIKDFSIEVMGFSCFLNGFLILLIQGKKTERAISCNAVCSVFK